MSTPVFRKQLSEAILRLGLQLPGGTVDHRGRLTRFLC
jgi:hypothetical protein